MINLILSLLQLAGSASLTLPLIAALTLIAGRRANASLCLWGAQRILTATLLLALAVPIHILASYFLQVASFGNSFAQMLAPLFQPAGLPWSSACLAWLCSATFTTASLFFLPKISPSSDKYPVRYVSIPLALSLAAAFCFYLSLALLSMPFAGLPQGLTLAGILPAIFRQAMHQYFICFCPAGAIMLAWVWLRLPHLQNKFAEPDLALIYRWFAVWALAGSLPSILQNWGIVLGLGLSGRLAGSLYQGLWVQTLALILLTAALFLWIFLIYKPFKWRLLPLLAFLLFCLSRTIPALARLI